MPDTYTYKGRDRDGKVVKGSLQADSTTLVAHRMREMGYVPLSIDKKVEGGLKGDLHLPGVGKPKLKDLAIFSRQFAVMINSGLSLLRALYILEAQTENKQLAGILTEVRQEIERGTSLSTALSHHPKTFSRLYIAMVRAGEIGGVLDAVLLQLSDTLEKQVALRQKVKSAMTYPVVVLCLVLLIVAGMLLFVVPTFKNLYSELGGTLPLPTRVLITVSTIATKGLPVVILGIVAMVFGFKRWVETDKGRSTFDRFKLRMPVFGGLVHKTVLVRFSRTLAALLRAGVPVLESLEITAETSGNTVAAAATKDLQDGIKQGEQLAQRMANHEIFPPMVVQMVSVGEETGAVDEMLDRVGAFYEQEVEATVDALTSLLEPLLIVVLGGAVGSMVIALYMPLFNIIKLIK